MKNLLFLISFITLISCSSHVPQKEEALTQETSSRDQEKLIKYIDSGAYSSFKELTQKRDLSGSSQLHHYLASTCYNRPQIVSQQMALALMKSGAKVREENFEVSAKKTLKPPLLSTLENGCPQLLGVYLENMSGSDIVKASLALSSIDFISFTEKLSEREPQSSDLAQIELIPRSVDMAIGKNSELCLDDQAHCRARDHLLGQYEQMKEAVAKFAYFKACSIQVDLINEVQLMREQIEFGKLTGTASPETYDTHAVSAQELRGWHQYYQDLFLKTTGQEANLSACIL